MKKKTHILSVIFIISIILIILNCLQIIDLSSIAFFNSINIESLMTNEDLKSKSINSSDPKLGIEMMSIIDTIINKMKTNDTYRSCLGTDIPERFKSKIIYNTETPINVKPGVKIKDKELTNKIEETIVFLTKSKIYPENGKLKISNHIKAFYNWSDLVYIVNRQVVLVNGSEIKIKTPIFHHGLIYKFSDGVIGFIDSSSGDYYEIDPNGKSNIILKVNYDINDMNIELVKMIKAF